MAYYAYNSTGGTKVWVGQSVSSQTYSLIDPAKYKNWGYDDVVVSDIGSGDLVVSTASSSGGHITSSSLAISLLRGETPVDSEGAPLVRSKAAPAGWHYQLRCIEITTATLTGVFTENADGSTTGNFLTATFKDASNNTLTTQGSLDLNCTQTIIDFEPTWDYEMIGGALYQESSPITRVVLNVIGVPDLSLQYGGSVEFAKSINLKHVGTAGRIEMDGRVSKRLNYDATYHTNKLRLYFRHNAGVKHSCLVVFELFKATGV